MERKDIELHFYRSRGPGGQRKNRKETAVRIVHRPTGIVVRATESRYQAENRVLALRRLEERLARLARRPKKRIRTAKPRSVRHRELEEKRRHSERKSQRSRMAPHRYDEST